MSTRAQFLRQSLGLLATAVAAPAVLFGQKHPPKEGVAPGNDVRDYILGNNWYVREDLVDVIYRISPKERTPFISTFR